MAKDVVAGARALQPRPQIVNVATAVIDRAGEVGRRCRCGIAKRARIEARRPSVTALERQPLSIDPHKALDVKTIPPGILAARDVVINGIGVDAVGSKGTARVDEPAHTHLHWQ